MLDDSLIPRQEHRLTGQMTGNQIYAQDHLYSLHQSPDLYNVPILAEHTGRGSVRSHQTHHVLQGKRQEGSDSSSSVVSSSSSSSSSPIGRGQSQRQLYPTDSASNVHINRQHTGGHNGGHNMRPIVEEHSDIEYAHGRQSPVITPLRAPAYGQPIVVGPSGSLPGIPHHHQQPVFVVEENSTGQRTHHTGGHHTGGHHTGGHYEPQYQTHPGRQEIVIPEHIERSRHSPIDVRDVHGNPQKVHEILLDGSGVSLLPQMTSCASLLTRRYRFRKFLCQLMEM